jgi:hypothetical protein
MSEKKVFVKVHSILNKPGNPTVLVAIDVAAIVTVQAADEEMTKIGAACQLDIGGRGGLWTKETFEELEEAISQAQKAAQI